MFQVLFQVLLYLFSGFFENTESHLNSTYELEQINNFQQRQVEFVKIEFSDRLFVFEDELNIVAFAKMFEALPEEQQDLILYIYSSVENIENPDPLSETFAKFVSEPIRESLLPFFNYFNIDLNFESFEIDEYFYNYWSEGNIKTVRIDSSPLSNSFQQFSSNERLGRVRLSYGTNVRLISREVTQVASTFHEEATIAIAEFVEVLDGPYTGRLGFIKNYNLY
ncbi:MAG: hypothetical protein FWF50_07170 [Defluviitaleaceae bacterium]|nr:hypothetical protein [Defluviitaleaceae bacterium]